MTIPEPVWDAYAEGETRAAIERDCPRCHAEPGRPCTNPVTGSVSRTACVARLTAKGDS